MLHINHRFRQRKPRAFVKQSKLSVIPKPEKHLTKLPKYAIIHTSRYEAFHSAPLKTVRFAVLAQGVGTAFLFYDANGRLYKTVDHQAGLTHLYEYDSLNRLIFAWQKNSSGSIVLEVQNAYDELGRAKGSTYVIGDTTQTYGITYEDITGLVKTYTTPGNSFSYTYDVFDRLTTKLGSRHSIQYAYVAGSQRISTYTISQADASNITYSYTYDALGNITSIKKNGTTVSNYEYDSLGRLIREDDCANSVSWVYTYDNSGNLQQKYTFYGMCGAPASHMIATHPYNGSEISSTYTYSSSAWGDLLTGYNGTSISYDAIGNPTNWRNATGMDWHQRSLTSMSVSGTSVYYTYNADGIRTQKTVGTSGHIYVLDGSTILKETIYTAGTVANTLYYYYDESGISGVSYNGTKYSYIKNLQGDVIRIINSNGATVVEYKYDAWGNILSVTGSMASTLGATNPFRYRGYYYDTESGWYYLNSRYYDPQVGRFINADSYVSTGQGLMGYNMFAYCLNNPVVRKDPAGTVGVVVTTIDDGNPLNDFWGINLIGGCAGAGGSSGGASYARDVTTDWLSDEWDVATEWVSGALEDAKEFAADMGEIILDNFVISGGVCVGAGGSHGNSVIDVEAVTRMDIVGFKFEEGKFSFGRNEREAANVSLKAGLLGVMVGYQHNAFYDFEDNLISEDTTYFDISLSKSYSYVLSVGYHFEVSLSLKGIACDLYEYFSD